MANKQLNYSHYRQLLELRKQQLMDDSGSARQASEVVELDQTRQGRLSRMDALQGQAMAQATESRRKTDLIRINEALQRIEHGTFGECLECAEIINPKRLESDPSATHCITCAELAESHEK